MLEFGGGHIFLGGFSAATKNTANPDIWLRLGRLIERRAGKNAPKSQAFIAILKE